MARAWKETGAIRSAIQLAPPFLQHQTIQVDVRARAGIQQNMRAARDLQFCGSLLGFYGAAFKYRRVI
jgi:hypothetical protein